MMSNTDTQIFTNARALLESLASAMNLINADVEDHHQQVAYLCFFIAKAMGLSQDRVELCIYAALLHDLGSIIMERPQSVAEVERDAERIALIGADMLGDLPGFEDIATIILHCQDPWETVSRCCESCCDRELGLAKISGIIYLADKVSAMLNPAQPVLNQVKRIRQMVKNCRGTLFCPVAVEAFLEVSEKEFVWLDIMANPGFLLFFTGNIRGFSMKETLGLTRLMSRIIDFRSSFTAMHSAGVAASARELARLAGMSPEDCQMMEIAGNLHDVGKLKVPRAILEKPGKLTEEEFNIVKEHPYYTRLILMNVAGFDKIANWAGFHHEKLNGKGYPFHYTAGQLDTGARIMAIADIFSAVTEHRPYRAGMSREETLKVMEENVKVGATCGDLTALLAEHYEEIDRVRDEASREAGKRYFDSIQQETA